MPRRSRQLEPPEGLSFQYEGFARLPDLFSRDEVTSVAREAEAALQAPASTGCERPHNTLVPLRWDDPIVRTALGSVRRMETLSQATGARDLRWISGYLSVKDPSSPPLWWHQDWWCWSHPISFRMRAAQIAVLTYLSETSAENGALRVLPGSHLRSLPLHAELPEAHGRAASVLSGDHPAFREQVGEVTVGLRPGDAVATDYRLLHGTHANRTEARRVGVLLSFAPDWDQLPPEVRGHLIQHPALPTEAEEASVPERLRAWLPSYGGPRVDLPLTREAPSRFQAVG